MSRSLMTFFLLMILSFLLAPTAWGFQYGQCLLDRSDSFNGPLKEYKNVALAKAAIKKMKLEKDPSLLRWNYETTRLIFDLVILRPSLTRVQSIYSTLRDSNPSALSKVQDYLTGASAHLALAEVDAEVSKRDEQASNSDIPVSLSEWLDWLGGQLPENADYQASVQKLRESLESEPTRNALGDLYDRIQEASVGATPIEPSSIGQWIRLAKFFESQLFPSDCETCKQPKAEFNRLVVDWAAAGDFPPSEEFKSSQWARLPPLLLIKYPKMAAESADAQKAVEYYYLRTVEDFLFGREDVNLADIKNWMKADSNHKIILNQAERDEKAKSEKTSAEKLLKYIRSQERVLANAFDHFVWSGQQGTDLEKSIDGVARTIYGEAESCQISGARQFEAIGAVIAARSISVDLENQKNNLFSTIINYAELALSSLSPIEIKPLSLYRGGSSDFGRVRESHKNGEITGMSTPAQVVSRPVQFSVWKLGKTNEYEVVRWINWSKKLGYPSNLKVIVSGPVDKDLDPAQRKVLCPNHQVFNQAVDIAKEVVTDYYSYANKYRFYQGQKRVVPYFYTHGPRTNLGFVKRLLPQPNLIRVASSEADPQDQKFETLPIYKGDSNCRSFKLYVPKYFDLGGSLKKKSTPKKLAMNKKVSKKSRRR